MKSLRFAVVSCAVASSVSAHPILIDNFTTSQSLSADEFNDIDLGSVSGPGIIGGTRFASLTWDFGTGAHSLTANESGSGQLSFRMGENGNGQAGLEWSDLGGIDITDSGVLEGFGIGVVSNNWPRVLQLSVRDSNSVADSIFIQLPDGIDSPRSEFVSFNEFTIASLDLTQIESIQLLIYEDIFGPRVGFPPTEINLDYIDIRVPTPGTLGVVSAVVLAGCRRRRP